TVGSSRAQVASSRGRLEAWARGGRICSWLHIQAEFLSLCKCDVAVRFAVGFAHIRKSWPKAIFIRANKWVDALQVDVIANDNQPPLAELEIDRAGRIGQDGGLNSHLVQHSHGINNLFQGVP